MLKLAGLIPTEKRSQGKPRDSGNTCDSVPTITSLTGTAQGMCLDSPPGLSNRVRGAPHKHRSPPVPATLSPDIRINSALCFKQHFSTWELEIDQQLLVQLQEGTHCVKVTEGSHSCRKGYIV